MQEVAEGSIAAFRVLYQSYQAKLYSLIFALTESRVLCEDIFQDVFLKIWEQRAKLPEVENFNAFVHALARNRVFDGLRRVANEESIIAELAGKASEGHSVTDAAVQYHELHNQLHLIVQQLPPQQKQVYLLSREEGLKYEEIAARLHISVATVNTHLSRAMQHIRKHLQLDVVILYVIGLALLR